MNAMDPIEETRRWMERAVIGLNLCSFAKAVVNKGQVRVVLSGARDEAALLAYERAQKVYEEEQEEAEEREKRDRERKERSASRGGSRSRSRGRKESDEGGGAAVLGVLAQLDRGVVK